MNKYQAYQLYEVYVTNILGGKHDEWTLSLRRENLLLEFIFLK
jgi:hypothetical protein